MVRWLGRSLGPEIFVAKGLCGSHCRQVQSCILLCGMKCPLVRGMGKCLAFSAWYGVYVSLGVKQSSMNVV